MRQVSLVVLKDLPGFSEIIGVLMPLIDDARLHEVTEDEYGGQSMN